MKSLSDKDFKTEAKGALYSIFDNFNPYREPVREDVPNRLLLYSYRWGLEEPWTAPFLRAMEALGEDGFFVSVIPVPLVDKPELGPHWYVPLDEINSYVSTIVARHNVIYSLKGKWGIICGDDDHAILAGSSILIEEIEKSISDLDSRLESYIEYLQYDFNTHPFDASWLPVLISHVYGHENMVSVLTNTVFEKFIM